MQFELHALSGQYLAARQGAAPALRNVSLHIQAGEQVAIIGPSGAGKTTLLHLLACALKPTGGSLRLNGQDPWQLSRSQLQSLRAALFLAPQVPPLPPRQRVVTAVLAGRLPHQSLWASLRSLIHPQDLALAGAALASVDMADKLFERVDCLSGGERQRVGLARLLVSKASLLLVDEPLSALDPTRSRHAIQTLCQFAGERAATLVATLHHVEMALAHFPRIIGLRDGSVAFDLPSAQVSQDHLQALYAQSAPAAAAALSEPSGPEAALLALPAVPEVMSCR